jgi:hypothetical protein
VGFCDQALQHLASYKEKTLRLREDGIFVHRGREYLKPHILPIGKRRENLLEEFRDRFFASEHGSTKLHRYFHHLNSSQALCINLFYPLVEEKKLGLLFKYLDVPVDGALVPHFEAESSLEVAGRRTSFDFHVRSGHLTSLYVEVKYTEDGFGAAVKDAEHKEKFQKTYAALLRESEFLLPLCADETVFLENYQILRNLVHISDTSTVVFLYPGANESIARHAAHARDAFLTERGRERLRLVLLEDLVRYLESNADTPALAAYYSRFKAKYLGFAS